MEIDETTPYIAFKDGWIVWLVCPECDKPTVDPDSVTLRENGLGEVSTSGRCGSCGVVPPPFDHYY